MELPLPASAAAPWLAPALWLAARATLVLLLAGIAAFALRRASAAARHLVWALALGSLLVLPAATLLVPDWELPFVRLVSVEGAAGPTSAPGGGAAGAGWGTIVLAAWAAGALLVLARHAVALVGVQLMSHQARRVTDGEWMERMRGAARELGLRERVRLLRAGGAAMPMTWGILRPAVLVPADADGWSPERLRVVLLHELAHVARRDCLWQTLASLCCAAYWFHPGVWWAARRMRVEREQACDDRVLRAGTRASEYAGHLLEVARASRARPLTAAAAVAMARRSQLEGRVIAVLDAARERGAVPGRAALVAGGVAAVALFPIAAAAPGEAPPPSRDAVAMQAASARPPLQWTVDAAPAHQAGAVSIPLAAGDLHLNVRVQEPASAPARSSPADLHPELALPDERALAALIRATNDLDPEVRRNAVWALGQMNGGAVVGSLVESMGDSDARVRSAAALALGEYAERQSTHRVAAARRPPCQGAECVREPRPRVPTGSAPAVTRPRNARSDADAPHADPALRILQELMEDDTLSRAELTPVIPGEEM